MSERRIRDRIPYIKLPSYVKKALKMFEDNGFEAYVVGGAVRDLLRGDEKINDYDITTNALPEETKRVFLGYMIYETGIKHGTVTVNFEGNMLEITTFRTDGEYTDSRHPDKVTFTRNITEDLARRDFTVNAMALSLDRTLVDPFGGVYDLADSIICAVGDPEKRFTEDALRIMRAFRFSAKLCYEIEEETLSAARKCANGLKNISRERIGVEWEKLLTSQFCSRALTDMRDCGIFNVLFPSLQVCPELPKLVEAMPNDYAARCAAFFKSVSVEELAAVAERICLKNVDMNAIKGILTALSQIRQQKNEHTSIFCYEHRVYAYYSAMIAALEGSADWDFCNRVKDTLAGGLSINSRADLALVGDDLINAGISDRSILSPVFSVIIRRILVGQLENEKTAIINDLPSILDEIDADRKSDPIGWRKSNKYSIK